MTAALIDLRTNNFYSNVGHPAPSNVVRRGVPTSDLVAVLCQEFLAVVSRHVSVDPDKAQPAQSAARP
jgi:hypothetical protein